MARAFNREELAWAAGLFEGEGAFVKPFRIHINQVDKEPLERFHNAILGLGKLYGPFIPKNPKHQAYYYWRCSNFESTQAIIAMFWPWLTTRRKNRAKELLSKWKGGGRPHGLS